MIIETLLVLAGGLAKPVYDKYIEPLLDAEKAAIRSDCRALFLRKCAALKKQRADERAEAAAKAAKAGARA